MKNVIAPQDSPKFNKFGILIVETLMTGRYLVTVDGMHAGEFIDLYDAMVAITPVAEGRRSN